VRIRLRSVTAPSTILKTVLETKASIQEVDLKSGYARVTLKNSIIGSSMRQKHMESDAMVAGVLAGIFEFITKQKIVCREVKCIAKGSDICEFIAEPLAPSHEDRIIHP